MIRALGCPLAVFVAAVGPASAEEPLDYKIELTTASKGYDGKFCWGHARAGAIPPGGAGGNSLPIVVMTTQKLLLTGE